MRLPWYQIDADAITKGRMLGRLLRVPESQGIGLAVEFWRYALEIAPEGDFTGRLPDAESIAAAIGWDPADTARLTTELQRVGFLEVLDGHRARGLDRYRRAWEKNRRKGHGQDQPKPQTSENTEPPARVPPVPRDNPARKTETEKKEDVRAVPALVASPPPVADRPSRARPPRKLSAQEEFHGWCQQTANTRKPGRVSEPPPESQVLNSQMLEPLKRHGRAGLERAWLKYLDDPWADRQGAPWAVFVSQWARHLNAAPATQPADGILRIR